MLEDTELLTMDFLKLFLKSISNFLTKTVQKSCFLFSVISRSVEKTELESPAQFNLILKRFGTTLSSLNSIKTKKLKISSTLNF